MNSKPREANKLRVRFHSESKKLSLPLAPESTCTTGEHIFSIISSAIALDIPLSLLMCQPAPFSQNSLVPLLGCFRTIEWTSIKAVRYFIATFRIRWFNSVVADCKDFQSWP